MSILFIVFAVIILFARAVYVSTKRKSGRQAGSGPVRSTAYQDGRGGYQIPKKAYWNKESAKIRRESDRIDDLNEWHENLPYTACKYSYTTEDPTFDFNGYDTVDEFAELRRRGKIHEAHLHARISNL